MEHNHHGRIYEYGEMKVTLSPSSWERVSEATLSEDLVWLRLQLSHSRSRSIEILCQGAVATLSVMTVMT